jgi:flagellar assembly protein FliH
VLKAAMNSSKDPDFSPAELEALRIWRLPDIGGNNIDKPAKENQKSDPPSTPHLTVTEIEAMQKQAYDEAFAQGKAEGFQQGFDEGFEEGSRKGYVDNVELLNTKAEELTRLMDALSEPFKALDEEVENELVTLSTGIAKQIIRREIKMDTGQIVAAVKEAIKVLPLSSQKISLRLHPEDSELVRSVLSIDDISSWSIVEDPLLTRGGCKIDTEVSHVDASVENRLAAVIATVFGSERKRDKDL